MAVAWILLFRKFNADKAFYRNVVVPVSEAGYGMYLSHLFVLVAVSAWLRETLGLGAEGVLGVWTTPVQILLTAAISYLVVAASCVLVKKIPKLGPWIMG